MTNNIKITCEDNMALMARYEDNHFDLAIVDPPYGIGISSNPVRQQHAKKQWDNAIPSPEYFKELFRVSKDQIIWGGNYFDLPPTQGFFIWNKVQPHDFSLAMCEYAWSSIQKPAKMYTRSVLKEKNKIHATQKPVELYEWLLKYNAKEGFKILDTHYGSGSHGLAVHNLNTSLNMQLTLVACDIDKEYYKDSLIRLETHKMQKSFSFDV